MFTDVGNAYFWRLHPKQLKVGAGAELRIEMVLAYYLPTQIQIGYAKGLQTGGVSQYYFVTAIPIF